MKEWLSIIHIFFDNAIDKINRSVLGVRSRQLKFKFRIRGKQSVVCLCSAPNPTVKYHRMVSDQTFYGVKS